MITNGSDLLVFDLEFYFLLVLFWFFGFDRGKERRIQEEKEKKGNI